MTTTILFSIIYLYYLNFSKSLQLELQKIDGIKTSVIINEGEVYCVPDRVGGWIAPKMPECMMFRTIGEQWKNEVDSDWTNFPIAQESQVRKPCWDKMDLLCTLTNFSTASRLDWLRKMCHSLASLWFETVEWKALGEKNVCSTNHSLWDFEILIHFHHSSITQIQSDSPLGMEYSIIPIIAQLPDKNQIGLQFWWVQDIWKMQGPKMDWPFFPRPYGALLWSNTNWSWIDLF